jgi:hypothetical protein
MKTRGLQIAGIFGLGIVLWWADVSGLHLPSPPSWALAWAGWILAGLSLIFGAELLRGLRSNKKQ